MVGWAAEVALVVVVAVAALGAEVGALEGADGADPVVGVAADGTPHAATTALIARLLPATNAFRRLIRLVNNRFLLKYILGRGRVSTALIARHDRFVSIPRLNFSATPEVGLRARGAPAPGRVSLRQTFIENQF